MEAILSQTYTYDQTSTSFPESISKDGMDLSNTYTASGIRLDLSSGKEHVYILDTPFDGRSFHQLSKELQQHGIRNASRGHMACSGLLRNTGGSPNTSAALV